MPSCSLQYVEAECAAVSQCIFRKLPLKNQLAHSQCSVAVMLTNKRLVGKHKTQGKATRSAV